MLGTGNARWYSSFIFLVCLGIGYAQTTTPVSTPTTKTESGSDDSLAAVARRTKAQKDRHAKKTVTDDDLRSTSDPLPRLKTNEAENGEEVIAAIAEYKKSHTPQETEAVIHRWYDEYDAQLADAIKKNLEIKALRGATVNEAYDLCQSSQDYSDCQRRRIAEAKGERYDQAEIARNSELITRFQHSLSNIRARLPQMGLRYEWFKMRTTNNIDRY
ncbi:MAG: hypothetical protein ACRD3P_14930 [Terriglobales bacterium]